MNAIKIGFLFVWLVLVGFGLSLSTAGVATEPETPDVSAPPPAATTVVGKVQVIASETEGAASTIQIVDAEEGLLIVDREGAGGELARHEGEMISATGVVSRRDDGERVLRVSSFRTLGDS